MLSNGSASTSRSRPRPPRREFVTTICTEDLGRYAGVGLTLDKVIEEELRNVTVTVAAVSAFEECDDLVIWEKNKVVALIRIGLDHRPVVTRFDHPAARPTEPGAGSEGVGHAGGDLSPLALAWRETRGAVAHFLATRRCAEEAHDRYREVIRTGAFPNPDVERPRWEQWVILAREAAILAERHLFHCILALNGKLESDSDLNTPGFRWPHCGVVLDDCLYLTLGSEAGATPVVVELRDVALLEPSRDDTPSETH